VSKILQLLFLGNKTNANKLYTDIFDRLGESVLPLINQSYTNISKSLISGRMGKSVMQQSNYMNAETFMFV